MSERESSRRWAVVLAGGSGQRMQPFVERWLGSARPKQYCSFTGGRTMLEHALERAEAVSRPERVVSVIDPAHRPFLFIPRAITIPGKVFEQPFNRDTGPGVFLPLTQVMAKDPDALVALFPSDHFIYPNEELYGLLDEAFRLAHALPSQVVLLSAHAERAETEFGWIVPGAPLRGTRAALVRGFREKPSAAEAEELYSRGALINTMICVARASALWRLGWSLAPDVMARFESVRRHMGTQEEAAAVINAYRGMRSFNFSRDLLERAADWTLTLPMTGILWCDWGRPERVRDTLKMIGREAAVPAECFAMT